MSERIPCDRRSAGFLQRNTLPHAMCEISDLRDTIYHKYFSMIRRSFYLCQSNHGVSPIRLTVNCEIGSDTYLVYQLTHNRVPQNFSRSKLVFWRGARDLTHSKRTIVYPDSLIVRRYTQAPYAFSEALQKHGFQLVLKPLLIRIAELLTRNF